MGQTVLLVVGAGCLALRGAGFLLPRSDLQNERVRRLTDAVPIVLLSALIAVEALPTDRQATVDERATGLPAAGADAPSAF